MSVAVTDKVMKYTKENGEQIHEYWKTSDELRAAIEDIERIRSGMKFPHWIDNSFQTIGEALAKELGTDEWEILGPFGICNETSFHFGTDVGGDRVCKYSITLVPIDAEAGRFAYKDYSRNTGKFAPNTIGAMNGMNTPDVEIPEDMTIKDLADLIRAKEE